MFLHNFGGKNEIMTSLSDNLIFLGFIRHIYKYLYIVYIYIYIYIWIFWSHFCFMERTNPPKKHLQPRVCGWRWNVCGWNSQGLKQLTRHNQLPWPNSQPGDTHSLFQLFRSWMDFFRQLGFGWCHLAVLFVYQWIKALKYGTVAGYNCYRIGIEGLLYP